MSPPSSTTWMSAASTLVEEAADGALAIAAAQESDFSWIVLSSPKLPYRLRTSVAPATAASRSWDMPMDSVSMSSRPAAGRRRAAQAANLALFGKAVDRRRNRHQAPQAQPGRAATWRHTGPAPPLGATAFARLAGNVDPHQTSSNGGPAVRWAASRWATH